LYPRWRFLGLVMGTGSRIEPSGGPGKRSAHRWPRAYANSGRFRYFKWCRRVRVGPARKSKAARKESSKTDGGPAACGRQGRPSSHRVHHTFPTGSGRWPHAGHEAGSSTSRALCSAPCPQSEPRATGRTADIWSGFCCERVKEMRYICREITLL
jgi:hypothetical protein